MTSTKLSGGGGGCLLTPPLRGLPVLSTGALSVQLALALFPSRLR